MWNLFKREVIIFLKTCVQKFTVFIWLKFESGKKNKKRFFFKRDILKKNTNKLTRIKNSFFTDTLRILHRFRYTFRIEPSGYHLFFLYHRLYQWTIHLACIDFKWYFNIGRIFFILNLRKYLISKQVIILILN